MIKLLRRLGRFPAGTETDYFDAAAEAAFVFNGTAEPVEEACESAPAGDSAESAKDYANMKKSDLLREAEARGLEVSTRAKVAELKAALEASDGDPDA